MDHALYQQILVTLIPVDQESRWRVGKPKFVEEYLREWPVLQAANLVIRDLLEAECLTRLVLGDEVQAADLSARFPAVANDVDLDRIRAESITHEFTRDPSETIPA